MGNTVDHPFNIFGFDHVVLRCRDVEASLTWYLEVLGLDPVRADDWRQGDAPFPSVRVSPETIIDLVPLTGEVTERNVDHLCLVADRATVDAICADPANFTIVDGPGTRYGAQGDGWSVYFTDPDGYVIEVRSYD